jgi:hypothetical protein
VVPQARPRIADQSFKGAPAISFLGSHGLLSRPAAVNRLLAAVSSDRESGRILSRSAVEPPSAREAGAPSQVEYTACGFGGTRIYERITANRAIGEEVREHLTVAWFSPQLWNRQPIAGVSGR